MPNQQGSLVLRVSHSAVVSAWRERERALRRRGVSVRLVSAKMWNEGGRRVPLEPGDDDFVVGARTFGWHPNAFFMAPGPLWRLLGERHAAVLDLHEEPCSVVVAEALALKALRRNRTPFVLYSAQNLFKSYPPPFRWIEWWALRRAAGVSVCNSEAARVLVRKGLRAPARLIPLGVDLSLYRPEVRVEPNACLRVGYVGRLEAHKGVAVLIQAVARLPSATLTVAGAGPDEQRLRALATHLEIEERVTFLGFQSQDALPSLYRELDAIVIPSLPTPTWLEQFCRVAVEAMASGVPVVASRSGAIPDVIGDAGILVRPGDADAITTALLRVGDPQEWRRLRQKGLRRVPRFNWEAVADGQLCLYTQAIGRPLAGHTPTLADDPVPPLEVLIVAYGDPDLLERCLSSLEAGTSVTVVDNSSSPTTRLLVERHGARYVDAQFNRGFAGGVNLGLRNRRHAHSDVLLLNPDAVTSVEHVKELQHALHSDPSLACVAPRQVDAHGRPTRVGWPFPSPVGAWLEAVGLARFRSRTDFVIGSILLLRGEAIASVGEFDERFFLYAEEADWQKRASAAGWRAAIVPTVQGVHIGAGTSSDSSLRDAHFHASQERYIRKHFGSAGWRRYRAAAVAGAAIRSIVLPPQRAGDARKRMRRYLRGPVAVQSTSESTQT